MKRCKSCSKRFLREEKQEEACEKFEKEPYMVLVEVEGKKYMFERIEQ